jgi:hypothetical protein
VCGDEAGEIGSGGAGRLIGRETRTRGDKVAYTSS